MACGVYVGSSHIGGQGSILRQLGSRGLAFTVKFNDCGRSMVVEMHVWEL